jgi:hypothetical protein
VDCEEFEGRAAEDVGVTGLVTVELLVEVGELSSFEPVDSLVRFFFKNPKVGI